MDKLLRTKEVFLEAYAHIRRKGASELLEWLKRETDFFTAPASRKYHGAYHSGLLEHSLNVYNRLREITARDIAGHPVEGTFSLDDPLEETVAILALLHDVCKAGCYHPEVKRCRDLETGKWEEHQEYSFRDPFPIGHGEKSLFLVSRHMDLTPEEAMAIRWHMGAYDEAVKGGSRSMGEAMNLTPWVWRLQEADMCAAWIDERD